MPTKDADAALVAHIVYSRGALHMEARDLIVAVRRGAALTQAGPAARLGRQQSTISAWESGTQKPAFAAVIAAIDACRQHLGVGLYKADDSYDALIAEQLRLEPAARIRKLTLLHVDLPQLLADLAAAGAQFGGDLLDRAVSGVVELLGERDLLGVEPRSAPALASADARRGEAVASVGDDELSHACVSVC